MQITENFSLKKYNTFGIDVKAKQFLQFNSATDLVEIARKVDFSKGAKLILGGGSNILFTHDFNGIILKCAIKGIHISNESNDYVFVKAGGGEIWHEFVIYCVNKNWGGIENLSLIPGTVGAAPIQNIGAYGMELKDSFFELEGFNLETLKTQTFSKADCKFGYRDSVFKNEYKGKIIILSVTFKLSKKPLLNTSYGDIGKELETLGIRHPSVKEVSHAICNIRRKKLPDPTQLGNAGSFFKNPIIKTLNFMELKERYPTIIGYNAGEHEIKVAAGWLIESCGWKGKRIGDAGVHQNQALVLVNYGNARGEDIIELAQSIQESVKEKFQINLEPEINII